MGFKHKIFVSSAIALLLTLSPLLILFDRRTAEEAADKAVMVAAAFLLAYLHIAFQEFIQGKYASLKPVAAYSAAFFFATACGTALVRIPIWIELLRYRIPLPFLIRDELIRTFIICIAAFFAVRYIRKNRLQAENLITIARLENDNLQLRLNSLAAQLQPHFFFNSLNTLSELVHTDARKSEEYILKLSNIFRYLLDKQQNAIVPAREEFDFAESYLFLMQVRFGGNFRISFRREGENNYGLPSLSLQILIENIFKHNPIGKLSVCIELDESLEVLRVSNTKGGPKAPHAESLGYGLANLDARCRILTGKPIHIEDGPEAFCAAIPLQKITKP